MTKHGRIEGERAPCGCPARPIPTRTSARYSQYNIANCPSAQRGSFQQYGTDLQVPPLIEQHLHYYETSQYQTPDAAMSWQSGSTQITNTNFEEGNPRYQRVGLNVDYPLVLTPPQGTNMNELRQLERAVIEGRALQISPSLHRFVQADEEENVDVDPNGNPYYASPRRHTPMLPAHFQSSTGSMMATVGTRYGNPSSRGKSSSGRSGRRSSRDESSSGYDNNNDFNATGGRFEDESYERASQVTMSEEDMFPFEEDQY